MQKEKRSTRSLFNGGEIKGRNAEGIEEIVLRNTSVSGKVGGGVELNNGNRIENLIINKSSWICFTCNETKIKILQNGFVE